MDIALFSPSSLFQNDDDTSTDDEKTVDDSTQTTYVERSHQFPGMEMVIREFSFHQMNANLLWPGTFSFVEWLVQDMSKIQGRRIIELGSGTGALAIFLNKLYQLDITTSDYDDQEIEDNIAHNCKVNGVTPVLPHIKRVNLSLMGRLGHIKLNVFLFFYLWSYPQIRAGSYSWGDPFPNPHPDWDLVIASDILLYVKQYPNLIKTLCFLLNSYKARETASSPQVQELPRPAFLMSWRRRIGKQDESLFFTGCETAGLQVQHLGSRVYCITPSKSAINGVKPELNSG